MTRSAMGPRAVVLCWVALTRGRLGKGLVARAEDVQVLSSSCLKTANLWIPRSALLALVRSSMRIEQWRVKVTAPASGDMSPMQSLRQSVVLERETHAFDKVCGQMLLSWQTSSSRQTGKKPQNKC